MTESMSRLIRDGKIVGYELHEGGKLYHGFTYDACWFNVYEEDGIRDEFQHDSFDMGIKAGDEWLFAGDIIEWIYGGGYDFQKDIYLNTITATGEIKYDEINHDFIIEQITGEDHEGAGNSFYYPEGRNLWNWTDFKRIGTIYDKESK